MKRTFAAILATLILLVLAMVPASAAPQAPAAIRNISVTDVTNNSFTVSWTTDAPTNGTVEYGPTTALGSSASDPNTNTTLHYVVVSGLPSSTPYFFQVLSNNNPTDNNGGSFYTVTTGSFSGIPEPILTVAGTVYLAGGIVPVGDAIVYLELASSCGGGVVSQRVSTRSDTTSGSVGTWSYVLGNILNSTASQQYPIVPGTTCIHVFVQGGQAGTFGQSYLTGTANPQVLGAQVLGVPPTAVSLSGLTATAGGSTLPVALSAAGIMGAAIGIMVVQLRKLTD